MSKEKRPMRGELLKLLQLLGAEIIYDGWNDKGYMNVDFPLHYKVPNVGIDFGDNVPDELDQIFRVTIHKSDKFEDIQKEITHALMRAGEKKFKEDYNALMSR